MGWSLDVSNDAIVVGTSKDAHAAAYVFLQAANGDHIWYEQCRLVSDTDTPEASYGRLLGIDGRTVVVGGFQRGFAFEDAMTDG